jgi:hypothetical protein
MGMEASQRRRTSEFVATEDQVNGRDSAGLGITCHEPCPAAALLNASRPSVRRELVRPSEGSGRVLHLDRRLGVGVAAANLRAPEHSARAQRVQARDAEGLRAREARGGMTWASSARMTNVARSFIAACSFVTAPQLSMQKRIARS